MRESLLVKFLSHEVSKSDFIPGQLSIEEHFRAKYMLKSNGVDVCFSRRK